MVNFIWKNTYHIYPIISTDISRKKYMKDQYILLSNDEHRLVTTCYHYKAQYVNYLSNEFGAKSTCGNPKYAQFPYKRRIF